MSNEKLSRSQRERLEIEQMLRDQCTLTNQLSRTIWMMAKAHPEGVTIDESALDPLWQLDYKRPSVENTKLLTIIASKLPEPTEVQLSQLAERLKGTAKHPGDDMMAVGLGDYPFAYISKLLAPFIVLHESKWIAREEYDKINQPKPTP